MWAVESREAPAGFSESATRWRKTKAQASIIESTLGRVMTKTHRLPRMIAVSLGILSAANIFACRTSSSEFSQLGRDTYNISTSAPSARGGSIEARKIALSEADAYCAKSGKQAFVTDFKTSKNHAEVTFRCEEEGQPKLQQP